MASISKWRILICPATRTGIIGWPHDGEGKYLADLSFSGSFDGNRFEIKNLQINRPDTDYQGLFGYTAEGASLANVSLENADVTGRSYTGGLVGANGSNSTIMNCYSTGSVNGSGSAVGGLVGRMYNQSGGKSEIINSYCLSSSLDLVELKIIGPPLVAVRAIMW